MQQYIVASSNPLFPDVLTTDSYQEVMQFLEARQGRGYSFSIVDTTVDQEKGVKLFPDVFIFEDQLNVFLDDYYRKEIEKEDPTFFIPEEEYDDSYMEDYYSLEDGLGT